MIRVLNYSVWLDGAVQCIHAYADACEQKRKFSNLQPGFKSC